MRKRINEQVQAKFFRWILTRRAGVFWADGRSNKPSAGRHSLGTRSSDEAKRLLKLLDLRKAVEFKLAHPTTATTGIEAPSLEQGRELYLDHARRPLSLGGTKPTTLARYRAVFDKFIPFAARLGVTTWAEVDRALVEKYVTYLDSKDYMPRSLYLEATTVKQILKWLVDEGKLPQGKVLRLKVTRPDETSTYCFRPVEVEAILKYCAKKDELIWLGRILLGLATTGMRISELADLRWSDVDLDTCQITLRDTRSLSVASERERARTTKGNRSRVIPMHSHLVQLLKELPRQADSWVFHAAKGGRVDDDKVRKSFIRDVLRPLSVRFPSEHGVLGFKDGRLHSFRHYFCSIAASSGKVGEHVLMSWMGHRASKMIRWYFHLNSEASKQQISMLNPIGDAAAEWRNPDSSEIINEESPKQED